MGGLEAAIKYRGNYVIDVEAGYGYVHNTSLVYNNHMGLSSERGKIKYIFLENSSIEFPKLVPTPQYVYKRAEENIAKLKIKAERERVEAEKEKERLREEAERE